MLTDRELQTLRNMGNEAEEAADEIVRLRAALAALAATPAPAPQLPQFIRAEVERAIAKAIAPTGMSTHDGKAVIGHDKLRYMLAVIDGLAATPAPAPVVWEASNDTAAYLFASHSAAQEFVDSHGPTCGLTVQARPVHGAATPAPAPHPDTERLDYLQKSGSTVSLTPDPVDPGNAMAFKFCVGGLWRATSRSVRDAIDAARAGQGKEASNA